MDRVRVSLLVGLVGAALSLVAACDRSTPADDRARGSGSEDLKVEPRRPALDENAAAEVAEALDLISPEFRPVAAARGLAELEVGRLGGPLLAAFEGFGSVDFEQRSTMIAAGLDSSEGRAGWAQVCPASFDETFRALATVAAVDQVSVLRAACDPAKLRLLGDDGSPYRDPLALALALVTYGALEGHGRVSDAELRAIKALAGALTGVVHIDD